MTDARKVDALVKAHGASPRSPCRDYGKAFSLMSGNHIPPNRPVWLAIIVLAAVIIAGGSGLALHLARDTPAGALVGSGAAFVATMTVGMAASRYLSG